MLYTFYIAGFLALGIIFTTYFFLGLKAFVSNVMLLGMYSFIVPCIFFSFGSWVEKKIVESQINGLIDELLEDTTAFGLTIPSIDFNVDTSEDEKVAESNKKLVEKSFLFVSIFTIVCFIFTFLAWNYMKNNFSYKHVFYENLIILIFIVIVELLYFGIIVRNYKTLDSNEIIAQILNELGAKLDP